MTRTIPRSRLAEPTPTSTTCTPPPEPSTSNITASSSEDVHGCKMDRSDHGDYDETTLRSVVADVVPRISRPATVNVPMNADMYLAFATPDGRG